MTDLPTPPAPESADPAGPPANVPVGALGAGGAGAAGRRRVADSSLRERVAPAYHLPPSLVHPRGSRPRGVGSGRGLSLGEVLQLGIALAFGLAALLFFWVQEPVAGATMGGVALLAWMLPWAFEEEP